MHMSAHQTKIAVHSLKEGMFVSELDCPWHETPFPLQGFYVKSEEDVKVLAHYCKHVYVDVQKEKAKSVYASHTPFNPEKKEAPAKSKEDKNVLKLPPIVIKSPTQYKEPANMHKEVGKAKKLLTSERYPSSQRRRSCFTGFF